MNRQIADEVVKAEIEMIKQENYLHKDKGRMEGI